MKPSQNELNNPTNQFQDRLDACRQTVKVSAMFRDLSDALTPYRDTIEKVRCLAIGSFYEDFPARYQLALLLELIEFLAGEKKRSITVSIYDPVFTPSDLQFIKDRGPDWACEEIDSQPLEDSSRDQILFFLPHAPLDLTEKVLKTEKPSLWLANNVVAHTDRYTKLQLHEKYPVISKLLNVLKSPPKGGSCPLKKPEDEEFKTFTSKKKKRRNKRIFVEPEIDYRSVESHFETCNILTNFEDGYLLKNLPWVNSFSDLTLHYIN